MLPSPTTPSVLPRSSLPRNFFFSHFPDFVEALACGTARAIESINASVCSATEIALPPGVFITSTPASVAAGMSTLSTPTPARPITRSLGAAAKTSLSTFTALRTTRASQSARCGRYVFGSAMTISQPVCACSNSIAAGASGSATRTFMGRQLPQRQFRFWKGDFSVDSLCRRHAASESHWPAVRRQNDLELRNYREQIVEIEITEMRQPENLPFHRALPIGDYGVEAVAKFFYDDARVHARRGTHRRHRRSR